MRRPLLATCLASALLGCGGARSLPDEPTQQAALAPRFYLVDDVEHGPVVVLDAQHHVEERVWRADQDAPSSGELELDHEVARPRALVILGPDGTCVGRLGRARLVWHETTPYPADADDDGEALDEDARDLEEEMDETEPEERVVRHTALVVDLEAPCRGLLAVEADATSVSWRPAARVEYEVLPARGDHVIPLGPGLDVLEHRDPPLDEICPASPELTLRADGQPRFRPDDVGYASVLGAVTLRDRLWLVLDSEEDRLVVDTEGGPTLRLPVPSRVETDWGASPCL